MKKKKLSLLSLRKWKISNLSLLHSTVGGTETNETDAAPSVDGETTSTDTNCNTIVEHCTSQNFTDCATNGGATKSELLTEYKTCMCNNPIVLN